MDQDSMNTAVVRGLRDHGVDVLTTTEAGRLNASDAHQLDFAARNGRVIYTANVRDFRPLHGAVLQGGGHHSGIIVRGKQRVSDERQLRALFALIAERSEDACADALLWLNDWL